MTIHLECASPRTSCNLPGRQAGKAPMPFGIMSPLFGFAPDGVYLAKACYQTRGALLPHLFTLTAPKAWRFVSVALSLRLPSPDVIRHPISVEPGLSSPVRLSTLHKSGHPANWQSWG